MPTPVNSTASLRNVFRRFRANRRGSAAVEFALVATMLAVATVNVADIAIYSYQQMQVEDAAQMGAQAAWKTCDETKLPVR